MKSNSRTVQEDLLPAQENLFVPEIAGVY